VTTTAATTTAKITRTKNHPHHPPLDLPDFSPIFTTIHFEGLDLTQTQTHCTGNVVKNRLVGASKPVKISLMKKKEIGSGPNRQRLVPDLSKDFSFTVIYLFIFANIMVLWNTDKGNHEG
jgi:hypothetical protein